MKSFATFTCALLFASLSLADDAGKKTVAPPEEDRWKLTLAMPGWMAGVTGDTGIGPAVGSVDVGFDTLLPKVDMIWATRAEASKGRFGILGELIYVSLSDGAGTDGVVKKMDVRVDQYLGDFAVRWRVLEGPRGYLDLLAGVRYTNLYQQVGLQGDDEAIEAASEGLVDEIGERLRARIEERIGEGQFRNALVEAIDERVTEDLTAVTGPEVKNRSIPNAPLAVRHHRNVSGILERLVWRKERELVASTLSTARAAAAADVAAAQAVTAAARSAAQARAAALRATVNQRIAAAKADLTKKINKALDSSLNQQFSRTDDWWDPYVGLRALSMDYEGDGLTYDTITHGAQITLGITF